MTPLDVLGSWDPACVPVLAAIELLSQRWAMRLVWELQPSPVRLEDLCDRMGGCSTDELAARLDLLRRENLVHNVEGTVYGLTMLGTQLALSLNAVWEWSRLWHKRTTEQTSESLGSVHFR